MRDQPVKECAAPARRSGSDTSDEVIHIEEAAPRKAFRDAVARNGAHFAFPFEKSQPIAALAPLALHLRYKLFAFKVRTHFAHHIESTRVSLGRVCEVDGVFHKTTAAKICRAV